MSLLSLQNNLRDAGILISFSGRFSQGIIEELGEAIKKHMEAEQRPQNDIFNVFAVFIEQTQNIKNYAAANEQDIHLDKIINSGIVSIGKLDSGYFIWSGNLVKQEDVAALSEKLDRVVGLDKMELKKLYKEQLKKDLNPDSRGAGLGLIDIARKASAPIQYSINPIDEEFAFYELRVII